MTFIIILEDATSRSLATASFAGNERVLCQDDEALFPLLSRLDVSSYDTFSETEMSELMAELALLEPESEEMRKHIEDIRGLAEKCRTTAGTALSFTPFD